MTDFCPECLAVIHASHAQDVAAEATVEEEALDASVKIEEIRAARDIEMKKLDLKMAGIELVTEAAVAEAVAEVQADVIDAMSPEPEVVESDPVAVIVDNSDGGDELAESTDLPEPEHREEAEQKKKSSAYGAGWWYGG